MLLIRPLSTESSAETVAFTTVNSGQESRDSNPPSQALALTWACRSFRTESRKVLTSATRRERVSGLRTGTGLRNWSRRIGTSLTRAPA